MCWGLFAKGGSAENVSLELIQFPNKQVLIVSLLTVPLPTYMLSFWTYGHILVIF